MKRCLNNGMIKASADGRKSLLFYSLYNWILPNLWILNATIWFPGQVDDIRAVFRNIIYHLTPRVIFLWFTLSIHPSLPYACAVKWPDFFDVFFPGWQHSGWQPQQNDRDALVRFWRENKYIYSCAIQNVCRKNVSFEREKKILYLAKITE